MHRNLRSVLRLALLGTCAEPAVFAGVREQLEAYLADPSAGLILLALGTIGVVVEFAATGVILPGVAGTVLLILAVNSLAAAPAGLALFALALILVFLEARLRSRGLLTTAAAVATFFAIRISDPAANAIIAACAAIAAPAALAFLLSAATAARRSKLAILNKGAHPQA